MFNCSLTIYGTIENDTEFYYGELSENPSMLATVEYNITYNYTASLIQCPECYPRFEIYTTKDDQSLVTKCSNDIYGQLRNENLHTPLKLRSKPYRFTQCKLDSDDTDIMHCYGKTTIQDYIPRYYGFSLGFTCEQPIKGSLRGISYNISLYDETNQTQCLQMPTLIDEYYCAKLYNYMSLPNLIGDLNWNDILKWKNALKGAELLSFALGLKDSFQRCYQMVSEIVCYTMLPRCDPTDNQVIHLCKEMCEDSKEACVETGIMLLQEASSYKVHSIYNWQRASERDPSTWINCDYLPSRYGSIPCFYEPVICDAPPNVTNAVIVEANRTYEAKTQIEYSCESDKFHMEGNSTVTCLYSGQWSKTPRCLQKTNALMIVLPLLSIPLALFVASHFIMKYRTKKKEDSLTRIRQFDAFVCYEYNDEDQRFAEETLRVELEERQSPPFKLCIHRRDFQAATDIMWNIKNAITNSNSAIIVMSQDCVNSLWCKEEFEQCYMENMKDPAFKLFVIMMQPEKDLVNTSKYMESFFSHKTYLEKDDPKLIKKIADYLTRVKQLKEKKRKNVDNNPDKDQEERIKMLKC